MYCPVVIRALVCLFLFQIAWKETSEAFPQWNAMTSSIAFPSLNGDKNCSTTNRKVLKSFSSRQEEEASEETTDYDIIIVGAGITGLATAAALLHREHFPPSRLLIIEKARSLHPIGATLGLFPNGFAALQSICPKLAQTVTSCGVAYRGVRQYNQGGQLVRDIVIKKEDKNDSENTNAAANAGNNNVYILAWYLLQQALIGTISKACTTIHETSPLETIHPLQQKKGLSEVLKLGVQFESFCQNPNTGILTVSARDRNVIDSELWNVTCKVLIGADGIQSKVRDCVLEQTRSFSATPPHPQYMFHNRVMYRAILRRDEFDSKIIFPPQGYTLTYRCGKPGKVFAFRENAKDVFSFTSAVLVTNESEASICVGTKQSRLRRHFEEYPLPVQHLIESVRDSAIYENAIYDLNLPTRWSRDSALLIGDAAHAMTPALGQGGNIGLEDATELAYTLGKLFRKQENVKKIVKEVRFNHTINKEEIEKEFELFWKRRIERTTMVHALSRQCSEERNRGNPNPKIDRETIYNWKPSFSF